MKRTTIMSFDHCFFFFFNLEGCLRDSIQMNECSIPSTWFKFIKSHVYIPTFIMNSSKHPTQLASTEEETHPWENNLWGCFSHSIDSVQRGEKGDQTLQLLEGSFRREREEEEEEEKESSITTSLLQNHHGL